MFTLTKAEMFTLTKAEMFTLTKAEMFTMTKAEMLSLFFKVLNYQEMYYQDIYRPEDLSS
jgi:hypothetical protein